MKKSILSVLLPFVLFGFEVNFTQNFSTKVTPNELSTNLTISSQKNQEIDAISSLDIYNRLISNSSLITKDSGKLSVFPLYKYKEGKSILLGYKSTITYRIVTNNNNDMNLFLSSLYNLKNKHDASIVFSSLQWSVDSNEYNKNLELLRTNVILWALNYKSDLSKKINKHCSIKKIDISSNNFQPHIYASDRNLKMTTLDTNFTPIQTQEEIRINPTVILECK